MFWNKRPYQCSVPINTHGSNVAMFSLLCRYDKFHTYCQTTNINIEEYINDPLTIEEVEAHSTKVSDEESKHGEMREHMTEDSEEEDSWPVKSFLTEPHKFNLDGKNTKRLSKGAPTIIIDEEERLPSHVAKLLQLHYDFGHLSFTKLQEMAK